MHLQFLGTGAGTPSRERNVTSIALDLHGVRNATWLFDCGEGTQHQILRTPIKPGRIEKIFITHLHGDHLFGLPGLLTSRSMNGCVEPMTLYGPAGIKTFVETSLSLSGSWLTFPLEIIEISAGEVFQDAHFRVTAYPLTHPVECYGYRIDELDKPGALDAQKLAAHGVPAGPHFYQLKQGRSVTLDDGRVINGWDYVGSKIKGRSLAIFGDTSPTAAASELAAGVDIMVHEATLEVAMEEKANGRGHSSTVQAARVAQQSGAKKLIITHLSSRYLHHDCERLLAECRAVFPHTEMAHDFALFPC
ncbi:ribonuclease Z [Erwinia tasmaniensis]|uniref:Ribonuclease BN n=1 Tax=Erwinia tasmaniensis (strain DSM 17950 / CFBP 7177 / CIP 109463 / NCPPB 4357 / Et1/99) TaxID=465817 RepID=RBN_ERWT9|nr:ribonuclease Z [Erwinia tasmaniensis]B2VHF1.1 RecName: Full=Ribonuclease BN; Short=RNase BN; AltName: Full=Ribonuclease Z homolog; Short=RNase Z homolog [Erwinia tasmaniensis Et1/99]CAO98371.1 Ribonuclease Z [Erwinia tasmaniensis Et1/99]